MAPAGSTKFAQYRLTPKIVRPHHMVSGPERLLPVFRFHTNLPAMKTRELSKVRIPSLITGPEYPFSTQSETFLIVSLAERSINTMPPAIAATETSERLLLGRCLASKIRVRKQGRLETSKRS